MAEKDYFSLSSSGNKALFELNIIEDEIEPNETIYVCRVVEE